MSRAYCRTDTERWVAYVDTSGDCWEWTGALSRKGYGFVSSGGKTKQAHRWSYEMNIGQIPEGMVVMHKCDNPKCVNPAHLKCGTQSQNIADRDSKGRTSRGSSLSPSDQDRIRDLSKTTGRGYKAIGKWLGLSPYKVRGILRHA